MNRVSPEQMQRLLDLLSKDGVLIDGQVRYANTNRDNFWKKIAMQLNSIEGGGSKNACQWCKMWADWKNNTKRKVVTLKKRKKSGLIKQASSKLTNLELRLLKLINYPVNSIDDSMDLEMSINSVEEFDNEMPNEVVEIETLDYFNGDAANLQNKDEIISVDQDQTGHYNNQEKSTFLNENDVSNDDNDFGECSSGTDTKESVKLKCNAYERRRMSLEELKIRSTTVIEKQRLQQKSEELRLRALELKLKGDELKLKEIEMNKIGHLTDIEEEKLKCFRDIASSLKELLERSKSGNLSLSNNL